MEDDETDSLDLDDLGPPGASSRDPDTSGKVMALKSDADSETDEEDDREVNSRKRLRNDIDHTPREVVWSSEDDNPEAAYQAFKDRHSLKRKRAAAARRPDQRGSRTSVVGRRPRQQLQEPPRKPRRRQYVLKEDGTRDSVSESGPGEDDLDDEALPQYLKTRKRQFERARARLGEAGLKLPPSYDDIEFSDDERLEQLLEKPQLPANMRPCRKYEDFNMPRSAGIIPAPIAQWLRDYQVKGTEFLHEMFVWQRGGILGDDMGLGKTIQVIAFLTAAFGKTGDERDAKRMRKQRRAEGSRERWFPRALIVCPGSLMANWMAELRRWGWWVVDLFHGSGTSKAETLQAARMGRLEIMITTYTTYRINKSAINTVDWDVVIADECHCMKERQAEVTQAMGEVNAICRIGLTGTAIQNKYEELWTLLNWTNPGKFGSLATWKSTISQPLKMGQAHDATVAQLQAARKTADALVNNLLPQYFLRRMKSLIADQLPKKSDRVVFCPLTETQAAAYENFVDSDIATYIRTSSDLCECWSGKKRGWCCHVNIPGREKWQHFVFSCIVTLQKLSNHVALLIPRGSDLQEKQAKDLEALQIGLPDTWKDLYRQRDSIMHFASPEFCGKWKVLKKLLQFWHASEDKVLVFSHSVRLLKMLQLLFTSTTAYNTSYLDGSMSYEERAHAVDDFNADPRQFVFLISTRAGGVGLNITSANKVVVVDPNWNPSYDLQAQDRAYRIGQTRDVEVFRLVSAGTIEEIVYARQIYKQQQAAIAYNASHERRYFRGVQDQATRKGEIFGLANLFSFQGSGVVLRDIVNKTNVAESKAGVEVIGVENLENSQTGEEDMVDGLAPDDESAAMSQLAALVASGGDESQSGRSEGKSRKRGRPPAAGKKADAIQAILTNAGVEYTHENSEVVGTSKIEANLSRRAIEAGNEPDAINEQYFAGSQQADDPEDEDIDDLDVMVPTKADSEIRTEDRTTTKPRLTNKTEEEWKRQAEPGMDTALSTSSAAKRQGSSRAFNFKYRPPEDVRKRQFCSMSRTFGFEDPTEFALVVEGWTQAQRRDCLDKFYNIRRRRFIEMDETKR